MYVCMCMKILLLNLHINTLTHAHAHIHTPIHKLNVRQFIYALQFLAFLPSCASPSMLEVSGCIFSVVFCFSTTFGSLYESMTNILNSNNHIEMQKVTSLDKTQSKTFSCSSSERTAAVAVVGVGAHCCCC